MSTNWKCYGTEGHSCDPAKKQCCDGFECKRHSFGPSGAQTVYVCQHKDATSKAQIGDACGKDEHCSTGFCQRKECDAVDRVVKGACDKTRGFCAMQTTLSHASDF